MNWLAPLRLLLWPLSILYGAAARIKAWSYVRGWSRKKRLKGSVISVGNLTVGGTGKTPMVIWLAQRFIAQGKKVAILSRGYRGAKGTSDEIALMKDRLGDTVAFGVGKDRYAEGRRLEQKGVDIFLLDDGFQHLKLARDVDILLIDASRPLERERLLPLGRLREPVSAMNRADLVVHTRRETPAAANAVTSQSPESQMFAASVRLKGFRALADKKRIGPESLDKGPFFAFCGIGNADSFFRDLASWHVSVSGKLAFADHHRYNQQDAHRIEKMAQRAGASAVVTTEKDEQNFKNVLFAKFPVYVVVIDLEIAPENEFLAAIDRSLQAKRGAEH